MHMFTEICAAPGKFADSGYYAFFSQLVFEIMKVVSFKKVKKMYRDLRSQCASEYP